MPDNISDAVLQITQNEQRNRAAALIQSAWHKHMSRVPRADNRYHTLRYKFRTSELWPRGSAEKAELYAQVINANHVDAYQRAAEMFFADKDFSNNLSEALYKSLISTEQFSLLLMLYQSYQAFGSLPLHNDYAIGSAQFDLAKTTYADSKERAEEFLAEQQTLPLQEQGFYTVDLPDKYVMEFFWEILNHGTPRFGNKINIGQEVRYSPLRKILLHLFDHLSNRYKEAFTAEEREQIFIGGNGPLIERLNDHLVRDMKESPDWIFHNKVWPQDRPYKLRKYFHTLLFLRNLMQTNDILPLLCISPNYKSGESVVPKISLVFHTISSFNLLNKVFHGDNAIQALFTAGHISTRMIRTLQFPMSNLGLEMSYGPLRPEAAQSYRVVELVINGINRNAKPHGADCFDFLLTAHDLYLHVWRVSSNSRRLYHILLPLFEKMGLLHPNSDYSAFTMNRVIWKLTDMDFSYGSIIREFPRADSDYSECMRANTLYSLIKQVGGLAAEPSQTLTCVGVMMLHHMHTHEADWKVAKEFYLPSKPIDSVFSLVPEVQSFNSVVRLYQEIAQIIPPESERAREFFVADYMLWKKCFKFFKKPLVLPAPIIRELFCWEKNGGLVIREEYRSEGEEFHLDNFSELTDLQQPMSRLPTCKLALLNTLERKDKYAFCLTLFSEAELPECNLNFRIKQHIRKYRDLPNPSYDKQLCCYMLKLVSISEPGSRFKFKEILLHFMAIDLAIQKYINQYGDRSYKHISILGHNVISWPRKSLDMAKALRLQILHFIRQAAENEHLITDERFRKKIDARISQFMNGTGGYRPKDSLKALYICNIRILGEDGIHSANDLRRLQNHVRLKYTL